MFVFCWKGCVPRWVEFNSDVISGRDCVFHQISIIFLKVRIKNKIFEWVKQKFLNAVEKKIFSIQNYTRTNRATSLPRTTQKPIAIARSFLLRIVKFIKLAVFLSLYFVLKSCAIVHYWGVLKWKAWKVRKKRENRTKNKSLAEKVLRNFKT